ncbi:DUF1036 domain-containing protein [Microcystis aeruginosa]|uniref:DUF1036 domain-containing protein n=1 Tax=Microcystis aeruginosa TaxID=1126 RepID=UPI001230ACCE|nr:DUF1036 domain-containing protein [Microcystis aeruginosa]
MSRAINHARQGLVCISLKRLPLYFYAHSSGNNFEWAGDTELNVFHQPFKLKEPSHCVTSHSTKKFKKLDVGNSKSYLVRLTHHSSSPLSEEDQIFIKIFRDAKQLK